MAGKKKAEEQEQRSLEENFSELEELIEQLDPDMTAANFGDLAEDATGGCVYGIQ